MTLEALQEALQYKFTNQQLLIRAITHKSYSHNSNYERLEFMGDSILSYVIANLLYHKYPNFLEGKLSRLRAALVNQKMLSRIAKKLKLSQCILISDNEEKNGGRSKPSILADSLEAIFAAIRLDSTPSHVKKVIELLYVDYIDNVPNLISQDNKTILQEYLQARKLSLPQYDVVSVTGPSHDAVFTINCSIKDLDINVNATGKSKKEASQLAAENILHILQTRD